MWSVFRHKAPALGAAWPLMEPTVHRMAHDRKVFYTVVCAVAINMVYVLGRGKRSPQMCFHDLPMDKHVFLLAHSDIQVPIHAQIRVTTLPQWMTRAAHASILTFFGAKKGFGASYSATCSVKVSPTLRADKHTASTSCRVCTCPTAVAMLALCNQASSSAESCTTKFAVHMNNGGEIGILRGHRSNPFGVEPRLYQQRVASFCGQYSTFCATPHIAVVSS